MYGKDFWKRACLDHILEFILTGSEIKRAVTEKISSEERHDIYTTNLIQSLNLTRDKIIAFDWDSIKNDEEKKIIETEKIFDEVSEVWGDLVKLAFEMGFMAGLKIFDDAGRKTKNKTS